MEGLFADLLHHYTDQPAQLRSLVLRCSEGFITCPAAFPDLRQLSQLETLRVQPNFSLFLQRSVVALDNLFSRCHSSLSNVSVHGFKAYLAVQLRCNPGSPCDFLARLEITCSNVCQDALICLNSLTRLSLDSSKVSTHGRCQLTQMTTLVHLGLTQSQWLEDNAHLQPLHVFHGWACLQNLNIDECCIFSAATLLDLPRHCKVLMGHITPDMTNTTLGITQYLPLPLVVPTLCWPISRMSDHLVVIIMHLVCGTRNNSGSEFTWVLTQLFKTCAVLQKLHVQTHKFAEGKADVLREGFGCQLKHLAMTNAKCTVVDLHVSTSLTHIRLTGVDNVNGSSGDPHA